MRTKPNPVFYAEELRLRLADEPERLDRILTDPGSVELLTWNVFASLDTHRDRDYLAYRLQALGGADVRAPLRSALWTGRSREPLLRPSGAYAAMVRERARRAGGTATDTTQLEAPVEVPVQLESPDVLVLVETVGDQYGRGAGGRDRLTELIDAGLDQARRLSKTLAIGVVYPADARVADEVLARTRLLRDPAALARELPYRHAIPPVMLREMTWRQLIALWEQESPYLRLGGQPTRAFLEHLRGRGLT